LALILGVTACVVHDTPPVNPGYGYYGPQSYGPGFGPPPSSAPGSDDTAGIAAGNGAASEPAPYSVDSMPPEPLYEQMSPSPGDGFVWIDGFWHWNGYEWVWINGRWERDQAGYVYVEPSYDYVGEQFIYVPGYWASPARIPRHWHTRDHRHGRPTVVSRPVGGTWPPAAGVRPRPPTIGSPGRAVYPSGTAGRPGSTGLGKRPPVYRPVYGGSGVTAPVYQGPAPVAGGGQPAPGAQPAPGTQPPAANPGGVIYYPPPRPTPGRSYTPAPTPGTTWHPPAQPAPSRQAPVGVTPSPAPRPPIAAPSGPVYSPSGPGASVPPSAWRPGPPVAAPPAPAPHPAPSPPPAAAPPHAPAPPPPPPPPANSGHSGHPR
jgi:hypothetical protein